MYANKDGGKEGRREGGRKERRKDGRHLCGLAKRYSSAKDIIWQTIICIYLSWKYRS